MYVCAYICVLCVYVVCVYMFLYLGDIGGSWFTLGGQRTAFRNWLSPTTWILGSNAGHQYFFAELSLLPCCSF